MKFQHLPVGARFVFEDKQYTKISPLIAAEEGGAQRMIPRYAVLRPLDGVTASPITANQPLDAVRVLAAFAQFEATLQPLLATASMAEQAAVLAAAQQFRSDIAQ